MSLDRAERFPFLSLGELEQRPHVLLDGAPRAETVLTLSHWPSNPTPAALKADLSTQSALAFLRRGAPDVAKATAATIDHLDEDALASLFCLVCPQAALERANALESLARAGDFDIIDVPEAGRAAWALRRRFCELEVGRGDLDPAAAEAELVRELLGVLPELLDHPERFAHLWEAEDGAYRAGRRALERGDITVVEQRELDLAIVTCSGDLSVAARPHAALGSELPVHRAVLHGATSACRMLVVQDRSYHYYDRYETWVDYRSRSLPQRRDLEPLARTLNDREREVPLWEADAPGTLIASLGSRPTAESSLSPEEVCEALVAHLCTAPAAWWPSSSRALSASSLSRSADPRAGTSGRGRSRWRGRRRRPL